MIIDQLPLLGGDVQGTDEFPIERGTTTYKTTQAALIKTATDAAAAAQAAADDAQLAADDAQLAADNAQDTADEANAKGLPSGGTAGQVLTKADSSDYSASWEDPSGGGDVTADMLGIVIDGNSTPVGASAGQYVIVKNSSISGITDGLYTAAQAIPANTAIDSTYLTVVSGGGLNDLIVHTPVTTLFDDTHRQIKYLTYPALKLVFVCVESDGEPYTAGDYIDFVVTLPSSIIPIISVAAGTRKNGYVSVYPGGEVRFRLMKNQVWDLGCVIVPYL